VSSQYTKEVDACIEIGDEMVAYDGRNVLARHNARIDVIAVHKVYILWNFGKNCEVGKIITWGGFFAANSALFFAVVSCSVLFSMLCL